MSGRAVFLHGAGRSGASAWPAQVQVSSSEWCFLSRADNGDAPPQDATRLLEALRGEPGHLVAHSYGAVAAVLAARQRPDLSLTLTLAEPACLDLARGRPAVEAHIAALEPVLRLSHDPSVSNADFARRFAVAVGSSESSYGHPEAAAQQGARLRAMPRPWGTDIAALVTMPVPTLVVTGGGSALYEQVAEGLVTLGARHVVLPGGGHRVQDAPSFNDVLFEHWGSTAT